MQAAALALLDSLPVGTLLLDRAGVIRFANQRARRLLGPAPLVGENVSRLLGSLPELLEKQGPLDGDELRPQLQPGGALGGRRIGFRVQPCSSPSEPLGYSVMFQDITEVERMRQERDRLLQLASINEVMPAVLHELKNPLSAVACMLELLVEEAGDEGTRRRLHEVLSETRRVCLTLDSVGRFRHEVVSRRHWAIDEQLRSTFAMLEPQARARGLRTSCEVQTMPLLPFEPAALRAVLFNLFNNALFACREGDLITLSACLDRGAGELVVRFSDTGPGMAPEVQKRCTELFFTTKSKGSGVGLALCAEVASAAGGRLEIDSALGRGACITLHLPVPGPETRPGGA